LLALWSLNVCFTVAFLCTHFFLHVGSQRACHCSVVVRRCSSYWKWWTQHCESSPVQWCCRQSVLFPAYWSESSGSRIVSPSDSLPVDLYSAKFPWNGLVTLSLCPTGIFYGCCRTDFDCQDLNCGFVFKYAKFRTQCTSPWLIFCCVVILRNKWR